MNDTAEIKYDLEATPIEIKVVRKLVQENLVVYFRDSRENSAGTLIVIYSDSGLKYSLSNCQRTTPPFPKNVPLKDIDIFRITKILKPQIRIKLHCNNFEVFDVIMSENCTVSNWHNLWKLDVASIKFESDAVESYRALPG